MCFYTSLIDSRDFETTFPILLISHLDAFSSLNILSSSRCDIHQMFLNSSHALWLIQGYVMWMWSQWIRTTPIVKYQCVYCLELSLLGWTSAVFSVDITLNLHPESKCWLTASEIGTNASRICDLRLVIGPSWMQLSRSFAAFIF